MTIDITPEEASVVIDLLTDRIGDLKRYLRADPHDPDYPRMDYGWLEALALCEGVLGRLREPSV